MLTDSACVFSNLSNALDLNTAFTIVLVEFLRHIKYVRSMYTPAFTDIIVLSLGDCKNLIGF